MIQLPEIGADTKLRTGTIGILPDGHTLGIVNKDHEVEWLSDCILSITTETSGSGVTVTVSSSLSAQGSSYNLVVASGSSGQIVTSSANFINFTGPGIESVNISV